MKHDNNAGLSYFGFFSHLFSSKAATSQQPHSNTNYIPLKDMLKPEVGEKIQTEIQQLESNIAKLTSRNKLIRERKIEVEKGLKTLKKLPSGTREVKNRQVSEIKIEIKTNTANIKTFKARIKKLKCELTTTEILKVQQLDIARASTSIGKN